jgi:hypothetical protein
MIGFDIHQVVVGQLRTATDAIPNVRCELFLNRVDTTLLKAEVYDLSGTNAGRFLKNFMGRDAIFESGGQNGKIRFTGVVTGGQFDSTSDRIGTILVFDYEETWFVNADPITNVTLVYDLTPIQMFKRRRIVTKDDEKGLLLGWRRGLNPDNDSWDDESVVYPTPIGDIIFYPGLVFAEEPNGGFIVRDQLKAMIRLAGDSIDVRGQKKRVDDTIGHYLAAISFLENRRCNWFGAEISARGKSGKGFVSTSYRRVAGYNYSESQHIEKYFKDYASLVPVVVEKWKLLDQSARSNLDKAVAQMLFGTGREQSTENQLVYWHSCLDIVIKAISDPKTRNSKSEGFSRKLILACEHLDISWKDLYPYVSREKVFSDEKADFHITQYRNAIIHEGLYPEIREYNDLVAENARAKVLMERLVMGVLGLYNKDSPVGKYRIF